MRFYWSGLFSASVLWCSGSGKAVAAASHRDRKNRVHLHKVLICNFIHFKFSWNNNYLFWVSNNIFFKCCLTDTSWFSVDLVIFLDVAQSWDGMLTCPIYLHILIAHSGQKWEVKQVLIEAHWGRNNIVPRFLDECFV